MRLPPDPPVFFSAELIRRLDQKQKTIRWAAFLDPLSGSTRPGSRLERASLLAIEQGFTLMLSGLEKLGDSGLLDSDTGERIAAQIGGAMEAAASEAIEASRRKRAHD